LRLWLLLLLLLLLLLFFILVGDDGDFEQVFEIGRDGYFISFSGGGGGGAVVIAYPHASLPLLLCEGTAALQANVVPSAAEQRGWLERRARDDEIAVKLLELNLLYIHHQACLARKPSILSIYNLATALVRMMHSQQTAKFQSRFEALAGSPVSQLQCT